MGGTLNTKWFYNNTSLLNNLGCDGNNLIKFSERMADSLPNISGGISATLRYGIVTERANVGADKL